MGELKAKILQNKLFHGTIAFSLIFSVLGQVPPSLPTITEALVVNTGTPITFNCFVTGGNPLPIIRWYLNDIVVDDSYEYNSSTTVTSNSINFTATIEDNYNVYTCGVDTPAVRVELKATTYAIIIIEPDAPTLSGPSSVIDGSSYSWTCNSFGGNPSPNITLWIGNTNLPGVSGTSLFDVNAGIFNSTSILNWVPAVSNNGQTLSCISFHPESGTSKTVSIVLNVSASIDVNTPQTTYEPTTGTNLTMNCSVTTGTAASIIWLKDGLVLDISDGRFSGGNLQTPSLTITNVLPSDTGNYVCRAQDNVGNIADTDTITLNPKAPPSGIGIFSNNIPVIEGQPFSLYCNATGNPNPQYQWYRQNVLVFEGQTLMVTAAVFNQHDGMYTCRAFNDLDIAEKDIDVDVRYPPNSDIQQNLFELTVNQPITLTCSTVANPTADRWIWYKDGVRIPGVPEGTISYTIDADSISDAGGYSCVAFNDIGNSGNISFSVNARPTGIGVFISDDTVIEGQQFSLYCNATGYPESQYEWYRQNVLVFQGQTLAVSAADYNQHDGLYTCRAINVVGTEQDNIDVDVKYPPKDNVPQKSFALTVNQSITLTCNTTGNPTADRWAWYKDGVRISGQGSIYYTIDADSVSDVGNYSCVAFNNFGNSGNITFKVSEAADEADVGTVIAGGLTPGEIAAIVLGLLFFLLLGIALCCILQGCCVCCAGICARDKYKRVTPTYHISNYYIQQFYEVSTVTKAADYNINKYEVIRPDEYILDKYVTTSPRHSHLLPIQYTYEEEERRRRLRRKKRRRQQKRSRKNNDTVMEQSVSEGTEVYEKSYQTLGEDDVEVVAGPTYYSEA